MIKFSVRGDWKNTLDYLSKDHMANIDNLLDEYAKKGVEALSAATPVRTGKTASSWSYNIYKKHNGAIIEWVNTNSHKGKNIAILIQYGHGTGWGGYVPGIDYINPALRPIFDELTGVVWKEVTK